MASVTAMAGDGGWSVRVSIGVGVDAAAAGVVGGAVAGVVGAGLERASSEN